MIEPDKRKAAYLLSEGGMSTREIARRLGLSRNAVREIIRQRGQNRPLPGFEKNAPQEPCHEDDARS